MEVEFGWVVGGVGGGVQSHFHVQPNSVEVVLRLSWGCDNKNTSSCWGGVHNSIYVKFKLSFS